MRDQNEQERRSFPRHTPARTDAWLAWEGPDGLETTRATLHDISVGGAALVVEAGFSPVDLVFVKLAGSDETGWTAANVAGLEEIANWGTQVRVSFAEECPYSLFRAAVESPSEFAKFADELDRAIECPSYRLRHSFGAVPASSLH